MLIRTLLAGALALVLAGCMLHRVESGDMPPATARFIAGSLAR